MKRVYFVIVALFMLLTMQSASAQMYCAGRTDINRCSETAYPYVLEEVVKKFDLLMSTEHLTMAQKKTIHTEQLEWDKKIRAKCSTYTCWVRALEDRSYILGVYYRKADGTYRQP